MKKIMTLFFMVALATAAMAQQGSWYIGGAVGFSSSKSKPTGGVETVETNWAFAPEAGTFLTDDIQLGVALGFSGGKEEVDGNKTLKTSAISPTVYGRKFFRLTDNFSTFAGLYLSLINEKDVDYVPSTVESTNKGFGARVGVGIAYALSPKFTAVGQYGLMGFESVKSETDGVKTGTDSSFDFGVNTVGGSVFNIGIYYTFMGGGN